MQALAYPNDLLYLISQYYSIPRTYIVSSIDPSLFRPFTGITIALNQWLWGYNHIAWNIIAILVHTLTSFFIYYFIKQYMIRIKAFLLTLLFSISVGNVELVSWSHILGYNIFIILVVLSVILFQKYLRTNQIKYQIWNSIVLFMSILFLEIGIVVLFIEGLWTLFVHKKNIKQILFNLFLFLSVVLIWLAINWTDYYYHFQSLPLGKGKTRTYIHNFDHFIKLVTFTLELYGRYIILLIAPLFHKIRYDSLEMTGYFKIPYFYQMNEFDMGPIAYVLTYISLGLAGLILLILFVLSIHHQFKSRKIEKNYEIFLLMLSLGILAFVVLARNNEEYLKNHRSHYAYFVNVTFFIFLAVVISKTKFFNYFKDSFFNKLLYFSLFSLIVLNYYSVQKLINQLVRHSYNTNKYSEVIQKTIQCNKNIFQNNEFQIIDKIYIITHPLSEGIRLYNMPFSVSDIFYKEYKLDKPRKLIVKIDKNVGIVGMDLYRTFDLNCNVVNREMIREVELIEKNDLAQLYMGSGWRNSQLNGSWTIGQKSKIYFPILEVGKDLEVEIEISEKSDSISSFAIYSKNELIQQFHSVQPGTYKFVISQEKLNILKEGFIQVDIVFPDIKKEELSTGLFIRKIRF